MSAKKTPRKRKIVTNPYKTRGEGIPEFEHVFRRGTQLLHQNKPQEALPHLEQAFRLNDQHVDAGINLSGAYILTAPVSQSRRYFRTFERAGSPTRDGLD